MRATAGGATSTRDGAATAAALLDRSALPRAEARLLLAQALGTRIESLVARPEQPVDAAAAAGFHRLCLRRAAGEPVAYLLGAKEFHGRLFHVSPAVLVPRPETELLVELALSLIRDSAARTLLDLGTGSGCIAITLALEHPATRIVAADCSADALAVARKNARQLGAVVEFVASDWFSEVSGRFDVIVANPPYVADADPHLAALAHEPRGALAAGRDGLDALRQIVAAAPAHLAPAGSLAVEHGHDQGEAVRGLFGAAGFIDVASHRDLAGIERACVGRLEGAGSLRRPVETPV